MNMSPDNEKPEESTPTSSAPTLELQEQDVNIYRYPTREHHVGNEAGLDEMELAKTRSIAETLSLPHEIAFVGIVCMAQFMTQVGLGQCLTLLNVIGASFNITDPGTLSWLIAAYSLTVGTFILISGRIGDIFGYKRMMMIGFSWFAVWSMVAGLAVYSNHVLFVFARVFQGLGPAILLPNGLAIFGVTYKPGKRKAMVFAIFGAMAPTGSITGSAFAGLFALAWWPWAFWSTAMALAFLGVAGHFIIPEPPKKVNFQGTLRELLTILDALGAAVGVTSLVLINFAWNQAPIVGWQQAYVYVCLIIGILLIPVFFYIELRISPEPLIPFDALSSEVSFVLACIACGWGTFGIWLFYYWTFMLNLRHTSPLLGVAYTCPVAVSGVLAAMCTGWMLGRFRPSVVMTMALAAFTIGIVLIMTTPVHQTYWAQQFVCVIVIPWGMDMSFPAATLILSNSVQREHQGIAASLVNTIVNYSISLGLGFAGTVEVHINNGGATPADVLHGYRGAWYVGAGLSGLGLVISVMFLVKSIWVDRRKLGAPS